MKILRMTKRLALIIGEVTAVPLMLLLVAPLLLLEMALLTTAYPVTYLLERLHPWLKPRVESWLEMLLTTI